MPNLNKLNSRSKWMKKKERLWIKIERLASGSGVSLELGSPLKPDRRIPILKWLTNGGMDMLAKKRYC